MAKARYYTVGEYEKLGYKRKDFAEAKAFQQALKDYKRETIEFYVGKTEKKAGYTENQNEIAELYNGLERGGCGVDARTAIPSGIKEPGANRKISPYVNLLFSDAPRAKIHLNYMQGGCTFTGRGGTRFRRGYPVNSESTGVYYLVPDAYVPEFTERQKRFLRARFYRGA